MAIFLRHDLDGLCGLSGVSSNAAGGENDPSQLPETPKDSENLESNFGFHQLLLEKQHTTSAPHVFRHLLCRSNRIPFVCLHLQFTLQSLRRRSSCAAASGAGGNRLKCDAASLWLYAVLVAVGVSVLCLLWLLVEAPLMACASPNFRSRLAHFHNTAVSVSTVAWALCLEILVGKSGWGAGLTASTMGAPAVDHHSLYTLTKGVQPHPCADLHVCGRQCIGGTVASDGGDLSEYAPGHSVCRQRPWDGFRAMASGNVRAYPIGSAELPRDPPWAPLVGIALSGSLTGASFWLAIASISDLFEFFLVAVFWGLSSQARLTAGVRPV